MTDPRAITAPGHVAGQGHGFAGPDGPRWTTGNAVIVPGRRQEISEQVLDGEAILFDPRTAHTYQLNRTAFDVWRRCDGRASPRQIALEQCEDYDVDFETALDHVEQLVALFAESGLLESGSDS